MHTIIKALVVGSSSWRVQLLVPFLVVPLAAPLGCTESDADTDKAVNDEADDTRDESADESDDADESEDDNVRADDADDDDDDNPDASGDDSDDSDDSDESDDSEAAEGSGDFAAMWRQVSAQVMVLDTNNPLAPNTVDVEIPKTLPFPQTDGEVEVFEQIKNGHHVTYAWVQGAPQYYRITAETIGSEETYLVQQDDSVRTYTMEDGNLNSSTAFAVGTNIIQSFTKYKEYTGAFPPDGWPNDVIDAEIGAAQ